MERLLLLLMLLGCEVAETPAGQTYGASEQVLAPSNPITQSNLLSGKVVSVQDGDTLEILIDNRPLRIRLNGIDAPERGQPFGSNAKEALSSRTFGKVVSIVDHGSDSFDRTLGDVLVDGQSVNLYLVASGLAWHYSKFSDDQQLAAAEANARANRIGLWSDHRSVAPWDWRKLSKAERDKLR